MSTPRCSSELAKDWRTWARRVGARVVGEPVVLAAHVGELGLEEQVVAGDEPVARTRRAPRPRRPRGSGGADSRCRCRESRPRSLPRPGLRRVLLPGRPVDEARHRNAGDDAREGRGGQGRSSGERIIGEGRGSRKRGSACGTVAARRMIAGNDRVLLAAPHDLVCSAPSIAIVPSSPPAGVASAASTSRPTGPTRSRAMATSWRTRRTSTRRRRWWPGSRPTPSVPVTPSTTRGVLPTAFGFTSTRARWIGRRSC